MHFPCMSRGDRSGPSPRRDTKSALLLTHGAMIGDYYGFRQEHHHHTWRASARASVEVTERRLAARKEATLTRLAAADTRGSSEGTGATAAGDAATVASTAAKATTIRKAAVTH